MPKPADLAVIGPRGETFSPVPALVKPQALSLLDQPILPLERFG
jgi:hypothetical protein